MKIYAIFENSTQNSDHEELTQYITTKFEDARIFNHKILNNTINLKFNEIEFINKSDLIVICIQNINDNFSNNFQGFIDKIKAVNQKFIFNQRPVFIVYPTKNKIIPIAFSKMLEQFIAQENSEILDQYILDKNDYCLAQKKITRTEKEGELLRKINKMKIEQFSSDYKFDGFTCGIDPNRDYCGDAIEY